MPFTLHLTAWDLLLLAAVTLHATLVAYVFQPRWKGFLLTLPIPFTFATLALGRPADATNVMGLLLLLAFTHGVRLLHYRLRLPILPAIVCSALGYGLGGALLTPLLPETDQAIVLAAAAVLIIGTLFFVMIPHRCEPGHRSPLPLWLKLPIIALVIGTLVVLKGTLHGFMTVFPMVGMVSAYEARHSLHTTCRYIPVCMLCLVPMMLVSRRLAPTLGLGGSLLAGWLAFLLVLPPLLWVMWRTEPRADSTC